MEFMLLTTPSSKFPGLGHGYAVFCPHPHPTLISLALSTPDTGKSALINTTVVPNASLSPCEEQSAATVVFDVMYYTCISNSTMYGQYF